MREIRRVPSPTRSDLEQAAAQFFVRMAQELEHPRQFHPIHYDEDVAFQIEASRNRVRELDGQLVANSFDGKVRQRAEEIADAVGTSLPQLTEREQLFTQQLAARAEREQLQLLIHQLTNPHVRYRAEDDLFTVGRSLAEPAHPAHQSRNQILAKTITLREAAALFLQRKKDRRLSQSQLDETGRPLIWMRERFGDDRPIDNVTKTELRMFRDDITRVDVTLRGRTAAFEARLTKQPDRQIKSVTALRYWRTVQSFFAWCAAEELILNDPSAGLKLETRKGEVTRSPPPFTAEELKRLFATSLYCGYLSVRRVSEPGSCARREGHWWSGILLMFTGLRAGELSQFLPEDFIFDAEIPHLKVREEDAEGRRVKSAKNAASVRDVPLAPQLLELGLAEFVRRRAEVSSKARVFREFRTGTQGRKSDGMTKFWARYLRKFKLWKAGRATHVWRHTVVACLRANEVPEEDIAAFVGHSRGTVTAGYGGDYPLARKLRTVHKLDYGFDVVAELGGAFQPDRHG